MIPYTTIPFVSAFFLVLVGILIAHLLWCRSREEHQQMVDRLRRTNEDLQASLQTQMSEYVRQEEELVVTRRERDDSRNRLEQMQSLILRREDELRRLRHQEGSVPASTI